MLLKTLSYLNIGIALLYFLLYLLNSTSVTILAMLLVIVHNGLVLKVIQQDLSFNAWHYILAVSNLIFLGFLVTWVFNIIQSSLAYNYFDNSWLYILISSLFIIGILGQFLAMLFRRNA